MNALLHKYYYLVSPNTKETLRDIGLLLLRIGFGGLMAFSHGLGKMNKFLQGGEYQFADPIGIGVPASLALAASAEFFCALMLVFGLFTRLAAIPLAFTMFVAVFIVHANDPFSKQEFGLLYMIVFLVLMFTGAGKYSLDAKLKH